MSGPFRSSGVAVDPFLQGGVVELALGPPALRSSRRQLLRVCGSRRLDNLSVRGGEGHAVVPPDWAWGEGVEGASQPILTADRSACQARRFPFLFSRMEAFAVHGPHLRRHHSRESSRSRVPCRRRRTYGPSSNVYKPLKIPDLTAHQAAASGPAFRNEKSTQSMA